MLKEIYLRNNFLQAIIKRMHERYNTKIYP